jgi:hypothetical protein
MLRRAIRLITNRVWRREEVQNRALRRLAFLIPLKARKAYVDWE